MTSIVEIFIGNKMYVTCLFYINEFYSFKLSSNVLAKPAT